MRGLKLILQSYRGLAAGALTIVLSACKSADDPAVIADHFVDAYYVEFDHQRALAFTSGQATTRVEQELALVQAAREKTSLAAAKARVYYDPPERRAVGDDMLHSTYPLEIREGSSLLTRSVVIMVARREGAWKVIQFREQLPAGAARLDESETSSRAAAREVEGAP